MRKLNVRAIAAAAFVASAGIMLAHRASTAAQPAVWLPAPDVTSTLRTPVGQTETAVFAGGCFWGIQSVFQHTKGVVAATSGYAGGWTDRPSYEQVSSGRTGHAESVRVVFDPSKISYEKLLMIFFSVAHNPTELNRQGPDVGTQYRSAIFFKTDEQKRIAEGYIDKLNKGGAYKSRIVTQVAPLKDFFAAEDYHQGYAELHPTQPYIAINDLPKVANLKKVFPELYTDKLAGN